MRRFRSFNHSTCKTVFLVQLAVQNFYQISPGPLSIGGVQTFEHLPRYLPGLTTVWSITWTTVCVCRWPSLAINTSTAVRHCDTYCLTAALSIGPRLSAHPTLQLQISADLKQFLPVSVSYSAMVLPVQSQIVQVILAAAYLFSMHATNYGLDTEASLFLDKSCDACRTIMQFYQQQL